VADFVVDSKAVEAMIGRANLTLSPAGLEAFLLTDGLEFFRLRARSRFREEGDDAVGKWAPLHPATVDIRRKDGYGGEHPINIRTGGLYEFITQTVPFAVAGGDFAFMSFPANIENRKMREKLIQAQAGNAFGDNNSPARPVVGANETDLAGLLNRLGAWFVERMVGF
jgi:hypothetical protein